MAARATQTETPAESTPVPEEAPESTPEVAPLPPELASRYVTAATSESPSADQVAIVRQNAGAITAAAEQINQLPDGRYKSLALTSLEEALMWANKAVFA